MPSNTKILILVIFFLMASPALFAQAQGIDCDGLKTYNSKCSPCHLLPQTGLYKKDAWQGIMKDMQSLMNKSDKYPLSEKEYSCILNYINGELMKSLPALDRGKSLYDLKCTICHQRPDPEMLKIKQWKHVIALMQERFKTSKMKPLTEEELNAILVYLEKALKKE